VRLTSSALDKFVSTWAGQTDADGDGIGDTCDPIYDPNTRAGSNVSYRSAGATVTFSQVTVDGTTTVRPIDASQAGQPPSGYRLCPTCGAYDITTTAAYSPPVTVCLDVPASVDQQTFFGLSLLHGENGVLVDRTTAHTTDPQSGARSVCGTVNSLSPFVLASGYGFSGFFQPVDNPPTLNIATAGSSIPVKFSLGGDRGLMIFAAGYPASSPIACDVSEPGAVIEETVTAGGSSLSYDASTDQYSYIWKTNKSWKGTCRMLVVGLEDGTRHFAKFRFK